ncbi:aldehyde dehydrogenase family protein [Deinococcus cavernae]|uniref:Aldehyde dehydrogenase n=1 Tax=Deinococcus cavernae TaxID=2320857 RepID=A0A418V6Y5_9DEIO|nr:aldehyde dehydrogenase family protein [Deinococcus cavernae]RJF71839.1 aldehyde dehydrogenase family protein [Deinococcus cavernae]
MTYLTETEIKAVFQAQQAHRARMQRTTPAERRALLRGFRAAFDARREAFIAAMHADLGKSRTEVEVTELHQVMEGLNHNLRQMERWMRPQHVPGPMTMPGIRGEIVPQPKGTVLILGPWNYPITNLLSPFVDALSAGNTVILKPSEKAPATAQVIQGLIEAVFEPHLVAVVQGDADTAAFLTHLPFDHILFTGNTGVGRKVMQAAAGNLTPVTLELGGKSPVVIDRSADLSLAAQRTAWGKLMNAGQTCIAPDYVLVPREKQAQFVRHVRDAVQAMYGDPHTLRQNPDLGRIISAESVARLRELVVGSLNMGATLNLGGEFDEQGKFITPTVLSNVTRAMPVMSQELFGPVLPILPYDDLQTALDDINRGPTPLALYAFGNGEATRFIQQRTRSGGMVSNGVIIHITDHRLPFGGLGHSGMGHYHGEHGFRTFSHYRTVVHEGRNSITHLGHPPFGRPAARAAGWFLRLTEKLP